MHQGLSGLDDIVANHTSLFLFGVGIPLLFSLWIFKRSWKDESANDEEEQQECAHEERAERPCPEKRPSSPSVICSSSSSCKLLSLDEELIAQLWPRGWILEGMEVSPQP
jgi:hypothetical protein